MRRDRAREKRLWRDSLCVSPLCGAHTRGRTATRGNACVREGSVVGNGEEDEEGQQQATEENLKAERSTKAKEEEEEEEEEWRSLRQGRRS